MAAVFFFDTNSEDFEILNAYVLSTQACVDTNCNTRRADFENNILPILSKSGSCGDGTIGCHTGAADNNLAFIPTGNLTEANVIEDAMARVEAKALQLDPNSGLSALVAKPTGQAANHGGGNLVNSGVLSAADVAALQAFVTSTAVCTEQPSCDNRLAFFRDNIYENILNAAPPNGCAQCHGVLQPGATAPPQAARDGARNSRFSWDDLSSAIEATETVGAIQIADGGGNQISLLLANPSGQDPNGHGGGLRTPANGAAYNLLNTFITATAACTPCNTRLASFEQDVFSDQGVFTSGGCAGAGCHGNTAG